MSSKHPKTAIAIIIDNSYSMNYLVDTQTHLDKAKEIGLQINSMLSAEDNTIIYCLDKSWNELHSKIGWGKFPENLIQDIELTPTHSSFTRIYQAAEQELASTHLLNKEIYFITDKQHTELPEKFTIPTFIIPTAKSGEYHNISCQNAKIVNNIVKKELSEEIEFELVNHSNSYKQDVIYQLFLDGNTIAEKVTDLQPNQRKKLSFDLELNEIGCHSGYVNVKNERLLFDNKSYFSFYHNPDPKIAVLTDKQKLPLVLQTLLDIYSSNVELLNTENLNYDIIRSYDNIIVFEKSMLSEKIRFILQEFHKEQKGILYLATKDLAESWQNFLASLFKGKFAGFFTDISNINYINRFHPVTQLLSEQTSLQIADYWQMQSKANILLNTEDSPIALEQNRSILWLFDISSKKTTFTISTSFPVFAYNCLRYTGNKRSYSYQLGDKLQLISSQLTLPNGNVINIPRKSYFPKQSGIFKEPEALYAVNLNYNESEFSELKEHKENNLFWLEDNWQQNILRSRYGFELWKYLVIAAIILLLLEMALVKREEKQI